jgi:hypothetical protein
MNEQLGCFEETLGNARQRWATSSSFVLSFFAAGVRGAPPLRICCCCVAIAAAGAANRRRRRRDCMLLHREFFFALPEIVFFVHCAEMMRGKKLEKRSGNGVFSLTLIKALGLGSWVRFLSSRSSGVGATSNRYCFFSRKLPRSLLHISGCQLCEVLDACGGRRGEHTQFLEDDIPDANLIVQK